MSDQQKEAKTAGRIAFEAYSEAVQGKTHDGKAIPPWDELTRLVQGGWEAAAKAVAKDVAATFLQTMLDNLVKRELSREGERSDDE